MGNNCPRIEGMELVNRKELVPAVETYRSGGFELDETSNVSDLDGDAKYDK